jgi:hypothetical protein
MRLTKDQRISLRLMFDGACAYCGQALGDRWHADHVEPVERKLARIDGRLVTTGELHRPERDTLENLMPACAPCNIDKHTLSLDGWRRKLQDACNVLARNQPTYRHARRFGLVAETGVAVRFHFERVRDSQC